MFYPQNFSQWSASYFSIQHLIHLLIKYSKHDVIFCLISSSTISFIKLWIFFIKYNVKWLMYYSTEYSQYYHLYSSSSAQYNTQYCFYFAGYFFNKMIIFDLIVRSIILHYNSLFFFNILHNISSINYVISCFIHYSIIHLICCYTLLYILFIKRLIFYLTICCISF